MRRGMVPGKRRSISHRKKRKDWAQGYSSSTSTYAKGRLAGTVVSDNRQQLRQKFRAAITLSCVSLSASDAYDHLPAGLVSFHHLVRFANFFEAKHASRFRLVTASRHVISDGLEREIREGKAGCAEHKTPEKAKVDPARHLQQGVEVGHRSEATEKARQAGTTTSPQHGKGVQDGAVADEIKHGVDPFPFRN